jgi:transposase
VLLLEIQAPGYAGGISQLKTCLAPMKGVAPDPVVRFESEAGRQMQADFMVIRCRQAPDLE